MLNGIVNAGNAHLFDELLTVLTWTTVGIGTIGTNTKHEQSCAAELRLRDPLTDSNFGMNCDVSWMPNHCIMLDPDFLLPL